MIQPNHKKVIAKVKQLQATESYDEKTNVLPDFRKLKLLSIQVQPMKENKVTKEKDTTINIHLQYEFYGLLVFSITKSVSYYSELFKCQR